MALADVAGAIKDGLLAFASVTGLVVMQQMMEAELAGLVGDKHARIPAEELQGHWHGTTTGSVTLGGRTLSTKRPRGRTCDGAEVALDTWKVFSSADPLLNCVVTERMLAGVATRRHGDVADPVGTELEEKSRSTSKSTISRRFVASTKRALEELMARSLGDLDVAAVMIDGLDVAGSCCVVALAITTDGTKVPVCSRQSGRSIACVVIATCQRSSRLFARRSQRRLSHRVSTIRRQPDQCCGHRRTSTEDGASSLGSLQCHSHLPTRRRRSSGVETGESLQGLIPTISFTSPGDSFHSGEFRSRGVSNYVNIAIIVTNERYVVHKFSTLLLWYRVSNTGREAPRSTLIRQRPADRSGMEKWLMTESFGSGLSTLYFRDAFSDEAIEFDRQVPRDS